MLIEVALALEIRTTNPKLTAETSQQYANWVVEEAADRGLDPWLLHGLVSVESAWTASAVNHEKNGTCSVGLGQINTGCSKEQLAKYQDPRTNLHKIGEYLAGMQKSCTKDCKNNGWVRAYNPGSKDYYLRQIRAIVARCHKEYDSVGEPAV
jgi:hypothetical protein